MSDFNFNIIRWKTVIISKIKSFHLWESIYFVNASDVNICEEYVQWFQQLSLAQSIDLICSVTSNIGPWPGIITLARSAIRRRCFLCKHRSSLPASIQISSLSTSSNRSNKSPQIATRPNTGLSTSTDTESIVCPGVIVTRMPSSIR